MKLKYSILYADDESQNLRVFRSAFRRRYDITVVESAEAALEALKDKTFDMLITDQRMPKMTGLDLLREIRETYPHMMRIILTGYSDINVIAKALNECRLYRYFTKPWSETEMSIALENAFRSYQLEKDNKALIIELTQINESLEQKIEQKTLDVIKKNQELEQLNEKQGDNIESLKEQYAKNQEQAVQLQEANSSIQLKNDELERAFFIIHEKNHRIMSSIRYARRIQQSILPSSRKMESILKNYFLFYKPKDIVSGDFYWLHPLENDAYLISVIDCTGHGVPGAFMSLIGHTILNNIIINKNITAPHLILAELHTEIITFLHQEDVKEGDRADDGMDLSVCAVYPNKSKIIYAGAKSTIYLIKQNGELSEYHSTRYSIGMTRKKKSFNGFENHTIEYQPGDKLYLFSDGIIDQHNTKKERFSSPQLKHILSELVSSDMQDQLIEVKKRFNTFRRGTEYRDDITLLGIEL